MNKDIPEKLLHNHKYRQNFGKSLSDHFESLKQRPLGYFLAVGDLGFAIYDLVQAIKHLVIDHDVAAAILFLLWCITMLLAFANCTSLIRAIERADQYATQQIKQAPPPEG